MAIIKCPCCRQERKNYRAGFCQSCYRNFVEISYEKINNKEPKSEVNKKIIDELLKNPHANRKIIAYENKCTVANITYLSRKYLKKKYTIKL